MNFVPVPLLVSSRSWCAAMRAIATSAPTALIRLASRLLVRGFATPAVARTPEFRISFPHRFPKSEQLPTETDMADKLIIFDTTLRDGEQSPGASMTKEEKIRIAKQLERMKVDVIEAGFAASSNGDFDAIQTIAGADQGQHGLLARPRERQGHPARRRRAEARRTVPHPHVHRDLAAAHGKEAAHDAGPGVRAGEAGGAFRAQVHRRRRVLAGRRQPLGSSTSCAACSKR